MILKKTVKKAEIQLKQLEAQLNSFKQS